MEKERRNELLDKVLEYNQLFREATKSMSNEEGVFFLEAMRTSIKAAEDIFRKAVENG